MRFPVAFHHSIKGVKVVLVPPSSVLSGAVVLLFLLLLLSNTVCLLVRRRYLISLLHPISGRHSPIRLHLTFNKSPGYFNIPSTSGVHRGDSLTSHKYIIHD